MKVILMKSVVWLVMSVNIVIAYTVSFHTQKKIRQFCLKQKNVDKRKTEKVVVSYKFNSDNEVQTIRWDKIE